MMLFLTRKANAQQKYFIAASLGNSHLPYWIN